MPTLVVYYSLDRAEEQPPSFLHEGRCTCRDLSSVLFTRDGKSIRAECDNAKDSVIILGHGLREENQKLADELERRGMLIIDYSSADPSYEPMWRDIRTAKDCCELVERLEYWIQHYTIDPIRRIKHRAMNLFAPLDTDCQYLLEVWGRKDYDAARRYLEELQRDWHGEPPYSNAPLSKLARLWYLLVGDSVTYPYTISGLESSKKQRKDYQIHNPSKVASVQGGSSLHRWVEKSGNRGSASLSNILGYAGLSETLSPNPEAGIYRFAVELQKQVIDGTLTKLRPDTPMEGFEGCKDVEQNFKKFREWIRALNNAFEALVEEIGEMRWTNDSSSSRGTSGDGD